MTRRGVRIALAITGAFSFSVVFVGCFAYNLADRHARVERVYYPVQMPAPIATDVPPAPKQWVPM